MVQKPFEEQTSQVDSGVAILMLAAVVVKDML